jgi:hypothetical protein
MIQTDKPVADCTFTAQVTMAIVITIAFGGDGLLFGRAIQALR